MGKKKKDKKIKVKEKPESEKEEKNLPSLEKAPIEYLHIYDKWESTEDNPPYHLKTIRTFTLYYYPEERELSNFTSVLYFKQEWLDYLYDQLKNVIGENEVQILGNTLSLFFPDRNIYLSFPVLLFVPEQEISHSSVSFSLDNYNPSLDFHVQQDIAKEITQIFKPLFHKSSLHILGLNIHKHPSASYFSSIDTDRNHGCIYRFDKANNLLSHDLIIYVSKNTFKFYCYEARIHNYEYRLSSNPHPPSHFIFKINTTILALKQDIEEDEEIPDDAPIDMLFTPQPPKPSVRMLKKKYNLSTNSKKILQLIALCELVDYNPIFLIETEKIKVKKFEWGGYWL